MPTVNAKNPLIKELLAKGVTKEIFSKIWIEGKITKWGEAMGGSEDPSLLHVYTRSDACGASETWAKYLGNKQEDLLGVGVYGDPGLAEAVKKDVLGTGYNNINYLYDSKTKAPVEGLKPLPIDINGNGTIDKEEAFYNTSNEIVDAIATGRYPSPPTRALQFVCGGKPTNKTVVEFIKWVLTDGQKYVPEAGYINLPSDVLQEQLKKLEI